MSPNSESEFRFLSLKFHIPWFEFSNQFQNSISKIFQIWSSTLFDLNPWIIVQIVIFENTQKSGLKSFKFPFEFIRVSSQIIQNQFSYSLPNLAQPPRSGPSGPPSHPAGHLLHGWPNRPLPPDWAMAFGQPTSPARALADFRFLYSKV
jgi:hypothetical protein